MSSKPEVYPVVSDVLQTLSDENVGTHAPQARDDMAVRGLAPFDSGVIDPAHPKRAIVGAAEPIPADAGDESVSALAALAVEVGAIGYLDRKAGHAIYHLLHRLRVSLGEEAMANIERSFRDLERTLGDRSTSDVVQNARMECLAFIKMAVNHRDQGR